MFYKIVEEYSAIIKDYSVSDFRRYGFASSLAARIEFTDSSILFVKDYLFQNGKRKYSFHWQTNDGQLISRWDNSPHHNNIPTFPHHRHLSEGTRKSQERDLGDIIKIIHEAITKNSKTI